MAIMLECRVERQTESVTLMLPPAQAARAYMLLDALLMGELGSITFGGVFSCRTGETDMLSEESITLCTRTAEAVKTVLLRVSLCPQEAAWLHVDIQTADGDAVICFG